MSTRNEREQARAGLHGVPESRVSVRREFELREIPNGAGGSNLRFTGFACVTDAEYEMEDWLGPWIESVVSGAFRKTLNSQPDVAFLLNHEGMTLARTKPGTLKLAEVTDLAESPVAGITGLHSEALLDPQNMYVQAMRSAVDRGDLDEMSFAFRVVRQEWNEDYTRRWINEVNMQNGDVSLVNYGANPHTGGSVDLRHRQRVDRASLTGPVRGPLRRAASDADTCNRCNGDGTIVLQGQTVTCPQCLGSGDGENNADDSTLGALLVPDHTARARLALARLRVPPRAA
jgi:HK97 family phage prohead protease